MKQKIFIASVIFVLCAAVAVSLFVFTGKSVNSANDAIEIAQEKVLAKYGEDFSDCNINAVLSDGIWTVSYFEKSENDDTAICGGGYPEVRIKQSNGRILYCMLQK